MELRDMLKTICRKHKMTVEFLQSFLVRGDDEIACYPKIVVKHRWTHAEGWWEVFKRMVSQWCELSAMESQNMYMAQRRILTVSPTIMLDYFKQAEKTGS